MTEHVLARVPTYRADLGFRSSLYLGLVASPSFRPLLFPLTVSFGLGVRSGFLTIYYRRQVNLNRVEGFWSAAIDRTPARVPAPGSESPNPTSVIDSAFSNGGCLSAHTSD